MYSETDLAIRTFAERIAQLEAAQAQIVADVQELQYRVSEVLMADLIAQRQIKRGVESACETPTEPATEFGKIVADSWLGPEGWISQYTQTVEDPCA